MREQELLTDHGATGRVTRSIVPGTLPKEEQVILPEEETEEQESPFFKASALEAALVKHVLLRCQQLQES
jgi:hypothetical protein